MALTWSAIIWLDLSIAAISRSSLAEGALDGVAGRESLLNAFVICLERLAGVAPPVSSAADDAVDSGLSSAKKQ